MDKKKPCCKRTERKLFIMFFLILAGVAIVDIMQREFGYVPIAWRYIGQTWTEILLSSFCIIIAIIFVLRDYKDRN